MAQNDHISRKALLEKIERHKRLYADTPKLALEYNDGLATIATEPAVEADAQQKWIPVTEKLPENEEPGCVNHYVFEPCAAQISSRGDLIRSMNDQELARYLFALTYRDFELNYCQNKQECMELVDADGGVPEENCIACLRHYLQQPVEEVQNET